MIKMKLKKNFFWSLNLFLLVVSNDPLSLSLDEKNHQSSMSASLLCSTINHQQQEYIQYVSDLLRTISATR